MPIYTYTTFDDPSSGGRTAAHAVNGMDQIVGTYINGTGHHGFFYNFNR
jgi:hypothetical protein